MVGDKFGLPENRVNNESWQTHSESGLQEQEDC